MLTIFNARPGGVLAAIACLLAGSPGVGLPQTSAAALAAGAGQASQVPASPTGLPHRPHAWHGAVATPMAVAGVHGLILRLRDAPDHVVPAEIRQRQAPRTAQGAADVDARRAALARTAAQWRTLLSATGLGAEPGLQVQPVGRNAWRVVFAASRSRASVSTWIATLAARPEVQWVLPNEREPALQADAVVPNDPSFGPLDGQWWLLPVGGSDGNVLDARLRGVPGFQTAWARTTGSAAVVVAVLDSGILAHPDLDVDRLLPGYDMVSDWDAITGRGYANDGDGRDADPTDPGDWVDNADQVADPVRYGSCSTQQSDWHGTAVAGFLAAATGNGRGVAAAVWAGRVLPVRVAGKCGAEVADIVDGMRWSAGLPVCRTASSVSGATSTCAEWVPVNPTPARIVNISYGGAAACNAAYQDAIDELHALGVVVVAAGGNNHGAPTRPANCTGVVGVAALNRDGFKAVYSNFGTALQIATVGGDDLEGAWGGVLGDGGLQSLGNDGVTLPGTPSYPHHYGTSFAAPIVSAAAALMLAADPSLTADELVAGLRASVRPHVTSTLMPTCGPASPGRCICTTATCGAGILDTDQAVAYAQAHARGLAYAPPSWPVQVIANADVSRAMALGVDLAGANDSAAGASGGGTGSGSGGGSTTTATTTSSGTGGGALAPLELLALALCAWLLGRGRTRGRAVDLSAPGSPKDRTGP